jgi:hypothetical protein
MTNNTYTKTRYSLKNGTKTVFNEISKSEKVLTEAFYNNVISAIPFMRGLGGTETATKAYTCNGYIITRIVSKSPCKRFKTIYQFNFEGRLV